MFNPEKKELRVFLSGVSGEFKGAKSKLKTVLKEVYGIEAYCTEADEKPEFREIWSKLEDEIKSAELFVLFLGSSFGAKSEKDDVSITMKEYYAAMELNKPVIVFRHKSGDFENEHQEEFYNGGINKQHWAPSIEDINEAGRLSKCILDYALRVAAEAIPILNNEAENFYVKCSKYGTPHIQERDGDLFIITLGILIENKDEDSHIIDKIWLKQWGMEHNLHNYMMNQGQWLYLSKSPIRIKGKDKLLINTLFHLYVPEDEVTIFRAFLRDAEKAIEFRDYLSLGWHSI